MSQKHGREYEHTLVNGLDTITSDTWITSAGYSGNSIADACDLVVTRAPTIEGFPMQQFNIEAKKRQGETGRRISNIFTGSKDGQTGLDELLHLIEQTPWWARAVVAIKMDHRKVMVIDAETLRDAVTGVQDMPYGNREADIIDATEPRCTPSENISMVKPETDEWSSATASEADEIVLAKALDLPTNC